MFFMSFALKSDLLVSENASAWTLIFSRLVMDFIVKRPLRMPGLVSFLIVVPDESFLSLRVELIGDLRKESSKLSSVLRSYLCLVLSEPLLELLLLTFFIFLSVSSCFLLRSIWND